MSSPKPSSYVVKIIGRGCLSAVRRVKEHSSVIVACFATSKDGWTIMFGRRAFGLCWTGLAGGGARLGAA